MSKQIAKLLKADISESSDLMRIARMLEKKGRGNDTILAHITKKEAQRLKDEGGSGTINPETGLLEFFDIGEYGYQYGADYAPTYQAQSSYNAQDFGGTEPSYAVDYSPQSFANREPAQSAMNVASQQFQAPAPAPYQDVTSPAYAQAMTGYYGQAPTSVNVMGEAAPTSGSYAPGVPSPVAPTRAATELTGDKAGGKGFFDKMSDEQKLRLGLAGGLGLFGAYQGRQAGKQAEARAGEMQALGRPYQAQGTELQRAAMAGELTPQSAQAYQALNARLAQGVEQRGGVGAAQAAAQAEAFRQQLLSQQYNLGLQVSNIGDNIAIGAIRTGMQADQQLSQVNNAFYTNLAQIAAGIPTRAA
jgi:hypothetical protein